MMIPYQNLSEIVRKELVDFGRFKIKVTKKREKGKNLLTSHSRCVKKFTLFPHKNPYPLKFLLNFEELTTFTSSL